MLRPLLSWLLRLKKDDHRSVLPLTFNININNASMSRLHYSPFLPRLPVRSHSYHRLV